MKKAVIYTIADSNNKKYLPAFENSLRKFHSKDDLPLIVYDEKDIKEQINYYRATPMFARSLLDEYELVLKMDVDQIICASLDEIINKTDYDLGVVFNSNPRQFRLWQVQVWNIPPAGYFNCGLVAMRSKEAVEHWWGLCNKTFFNDYAYREQDLLNILIHYGNYRVFCFDAGSKFYGLASNSYWNEFYLDGDKIMLKPVKEDDGQVWPATEKQIAVIHFAEGQASLSKGNYRIKCNDEVSKRLDWLIE